MLVRSRFWNTSKSSLRPDRSEKPSISTGPVRGRAPPTAQSAPPPFPEELRRVRLDRVTQLRPFQTHRPRRCLDRKVAVAVALALTLPVSSGVPLAAQPGREFVLEDLLKHKPHRVAHQLLQTLLNRFSEPDTVSMSARIVSIGDTRLGMAWVSFDEFAALEGTYARPRITPPMGRHLIRLISTFPLSRSSALRFRCSARLPTPRLVGVRSLWHRSGWCACAASTTPRYRANVGRTLLW